MGVNRASTFVGVYEVEVELSDTIFSSILHRFFVSIGLKEAS
jgi:hypothetical protein